MTQIERLQAGEGDSGGWAAYRTWGGNHLLFRGLLHIPQCNLYIIIMHIRDVDGSDIDYRLDQILGSWYLWHNWQNASRKINVNGRLIALDVFSVHAMPTRM